MAGRPPPPPPSPTYFHVFPSLPYPSWAQRAGAGPLAADADGPAAVAVAAGVGAGAGTGAGAGGPAAAGAGAGGPAAAGADTGSLPTAAAAAAAGAGAGAGSHAAAAGGAGETLEPFFFPAPPPLPPPAPLQTAGANSALAAALVAARAAAADSQARVRAAALALERERDAADALARQIAEAEQLLVLPTSYDTAATSSGSTGHRASRTTVIWHDPADPHVAQLHYQAGGVQNIRLLVPVVLEPESPSYARWRDLVLLTLRRYALDDHVLVDASVAVQTPSWLRLDSVVLSWIIGTISLDLHDLVRNSADARRAWLALEGQFLGNAEARALRLDASFRTFVQGDLSVGDFCRRMKSMADSLGDLGWPVEDRILVLNVLRGLQGATSRPRLHGVQPGPLSTTRGWGASPCGPSRLQVESLAHQWPCSLELLRGFTPRLRGLHLPAHLRGCHLPTPCPGLSVGTRRPWPDPSAPWP
ncbi:uncharacterized protein [Miscanthus floridulus]|uniref:uncharacterized protein n=1 Tax=Miscanthus floridulus TaxID=154761 RepID=UPI0034594D05